MRITPILKGYVDSLGRQTVFIRISNGKKRTFRATQIKVKPAQFKNGVIVNHEKSKEYNQKIRSLIVGAENSDSYIRPVLLSDYVTQCLNQWDRQKKWSTLKQIKGEASKIAQFANPFVHQINLSFLNKYKAYCYGLGNKTNSVWKSFKFLKMIVRKAHLEKLISDNPFDIFENVRYVDPPRSYLTREQVDKIEVFVSRHPVYGFAGTWFVIACYTGLRYSDQNSFDKSKIKGGRLIIYTTKTGQPVSIKVNDKLKQLFHRIDYKPMKYTGVHYNRLLKAIGAELGIKELVSSHVARHTFGTMCASAGISQEVTAKLMGHSSIKTTGIYYQITGTTLDAGYMKLF